jgi:hypothetical protein
MTPDVAPSKEEEHWDLRDQEASQEGLLADNRHQEEGKCWCCQAILETSQLILGDPEFTLLKIDFSWGWDRSIVDQEMDKL